MGSNLSMSTSVTIGTYIISGVSVDLSVKLVKNGEDIELYLPFPDNYPSTQVRRTLDKRGLIEMKFYISQSFDHYPRRTKDFLLENHNINLDDRSIYVSAFYMLPRKYNILATEDESAMLRGLGKKIFCLSLPTLMEQYNMDSDNLISLTAASGSFQTDEDNRRIKDYMTKSQEDLIHLLMKIQGFPESMLDDPDLSSMYHDEELYLMDQSKDCLIALIIDRENNGKLIRYYKEAFGFVPMDEDNENDCDGVNMVGIIKNIPPIV